MCIFSGRIVHFVINIVIDIAFQRSIVAINLFTILKIPQQIIKHTHINRRAHSNSRPMRVKSRLTFTSMTNEPLIRLAT